MSKKGVRLSFALIALSLLLACCCAHDSIPSLTTHNIVSTKTSLGGVNAAAWETGTFYAFLETESDGVVAAANRCSPELSRELSQFAKSVFGIQKSAAFVVTVSIWNNETPLAVNVPILVLARKDGADGGLFCEASGAAVAANPTRLTPNFRVDANQELKIVFDLRVVDDAKSEAATQGLHYAQQISSAAGPQAAAVGILSTELLAGFAKAFDKGTSSALTLRTTDQLTATLKRQKSLDAASHDEVRFDLGKYLSETRSEEAVLQSASVIVRFRYLVSAVTESTPEGNIEWPSNIGSVLNFAIISPGPNKLPYGKALDKGVGNFIPSYLQPPPGTSLSGRQVATACESLKHNLDNEVGLTPTDALAVRYVALREKTDYFKLSNWWSEQCLSGSYLSKAAGGPEIQGEADQLYKANPNFYPPTRTRNPQSWRPAIERRLRHLYNIAVEGAHSAQLNSSFRLTVDDPISMPPSFFQDDIPNGSWSDAGEKARSRFNVVAYGGFCAQLLDVHYTMPQSVKALALFGRGNGLNDSGFAGYRDSNGNLVFPIVTTWSADSPAHLISVRVASIETIQQDYAGDIGKWPRDPDVQSCHTIKQR